MGLELLELTVEVLCNLIQPPSQETRVTVKLKFCFLTCLVLSLWKPSSTLTRAEVCISIPVSSWYTATTKISVARAFYLTCLWLNWGNIYTGLNFSSAFSYRTGWTLLGQAYPIWVQLPRELSSHGHDRRAGRPPWQGKYTWGLYLHHIC